MTAGYTGFIAPLPITSAGMQSDFSDLSTSPQSVLLARNVSVRQGLLERAPGSVRKYTVALPSAIKEFLDYFPDDFSQRIISLCTNGLVYKMFPWSQFEEIKSSDGLEPTLSLNNTPVIIQGGAEQPLRSRKVFIFSGNNQIQVVSGDVSSRRNISKPAVEWVPGNYPSAGMIANGSLMVWGCQNSPHTIWVSNPNDHEDFTTLASVQVISMYPGDGDRIVDGFVYKTRPFFTKYPRGLYYLDTSGSAFIPVKLGDSFGASSPKTAVQALDDMYVANAAGSITSLKAVFSLGQTEQGDLLKELQNSKFATQYLSSFAGSQKRSIYYEEKKQIMIGSSSGVSGMNRMYIIDFTTPTPTFFFYDKDNMQSLGLIRDVKGMQRPVYGASDGYFYDMDSPNRNVNGSAFLSEIQTHNLDFKWVFVGVQSNMEERDKHFDYVGIVYEPAGNWTVNCDAYVDGNKRSTLSFSMVRTGPRNTHMDGHFPLDLSSVLGKNTVTQILPLNATGKKLRLRIYTSGLNQNFKIAGLVVYVRPGGQNQRSG